MEIGMQVWEQDTPPSRRRGRDRGRRGGAGRLYIPHSISPSRSQQIVRIAGVEDAQRLISKFAGDAFDFPCIAAAATARRNRAIVEEVAKGAKKKVVACSFGVTERHVNRICAAEDGRCRLPHDSAAKTTGTMHCPLSAIERTIESGSVASRN